MGKKALRYLVAAAVLVCSYAQAAVAVNIVESWAAVVAIATGVVYASELSGDATPVTAMPAWIQAFMALGLLLLASRLPHRKRRV